MKLSEGFELVATATDGIARLRELVLSLAVMGKLVRQQPADEPAQTLLRKIFAEKKRLATEGKISSGKPLTDIGDEEGSFDLPSGWQRVRLGDYVIELCTGPFGSMIHKEDYVVDGVPLVNPSHMIDGRIQHDPGVSVSAQMAKQLSAYRLSAGDIVLARRGEVGRYAHVTSAQEGWLCGTGSFVVKLTDDCNRRFLGLIFQDPRMRAYLQGESVGMTMTNLNQRILLEAPLAIPPLAEQARIVAKVDELMVLCDELEFHGRVEAAQHARLIATLLDALVASASPRVVEENWSRVAEHFELLIDRPEAVDALEQAVVQLAVRGLLTPQNSSDEPASELLRKNRQEKNRLIAEGKIKREKAVAPIADYEKPFDLQTGWEWVRLGDIAHNVQYGYTASADHAIVSPKFVRITDIQRDEVNWQSVPGVNVGSQDVSSYLLESNDLLIARTGGTIGKSFLVKNVDVPSIFASYLIRVRPSIYMDAQYIKLFLSSSTYWNQLFAKSMGTGQPNVNGASLSGLVLPCPPKAEQHRIVAKVENIRSLCADFRKRLVSRQTCQALFAEVLAEQSMYAGLLKDEASLAAAA